MVGQDIKCKTHVITWPTISQNTMAGLLNFLSINKHRAYIKRLHIMGMEEIILVNFYLIWFWRFFYFIRNFFYFRLLRKFFYFIRKFFDFIRKFFYYAYISFENYFFCFGNSFILGYWENSFILTGNSFNYAYISFGDSFILMKLLIAIS